MQLPPFNRHGTFTSNLKCSWNEFKLHYKRDKVRKKLIENAIPGFEILKAAGIDTVLISGSFVSNKKKPSDIDGVFLEGKHFNMDKLPKKVLSILDSYGLDFYPADMPTALTGESHLDFFRRGHFDEKPGLIELSLKEL